LRTAEHLVQRPHQVDGRRPCPAKARIGCFKRLVGCIFAQRQAHAIGRGCADQRCAAHLHHLDGARSILNGFQRDDLELVRQPRLVDDVDPPAVFIQPDRAVMFAFDFHPVPTFPEASFTRLRSPPAGAP
jgi:hypothetical protein